LVRLTSGRLLGGKYVGDIRLRIFDTAGIVDADTLSAIISDDIHAFIVLAPDGIDTSVLGKGKIILFFKI